MSYSETIWLSDLSQTVSEMTLSGHFRSRYTLRGRRWLAALPADERKKFSVIGHHAQSVRGINWHSLGGRARADSAIRDRKGRFV